MKRKRNKGKRILLYIFIASVLGLAVVIYVYPMFTEAMAKTTILEYGNLKESTIETCYFVRDEKIVKASATGRVQYLIDEGELVRKGTKIVEIVSAKEQYLAQANSLISYCMDGLEDVFSPEKILSLDKEKVESIQVDIKQIKRDSAIGGEPLYKEVDKDIWYVVLWAEPDNIIKFKKDKAVSLNLPLGEVKGTIHDIIDKGDSWLILLKFTRFYEEMQKHRKIEAEVVTSNYEGLIVANRSITSLDGKPGVYRKDIKGEFLFTPVSVISSDGEYSLVADSFFYEKVEDESIRIKTVDVYDEILNYPERMRND